MNAPAIQFDPAAARFGSSRSQKRLEDARLLAGRGLYSDDRNLPDQAWMVVLRSPHAHARIRAIDAGEALENGTAAALLVWCAITVALGGWAEEYYQRKDSQVFVTDEVTGFLLTVLLFHDPAQPVLTMLWAFPVTRIIDILKVPPARQLERLPRGWGVLADDLLGSVYAAALLCLIFKAFDGLEVNLLLRPSILKGS